MGDPQIFIADSDGVPLLTSSGLHASAVVNATVAQLAKWHGTFQQMGVMPPSKKHLSDFGATLTGRRFYIVVRCTAHVRVRGCVGVCVCKRVRKRV
jgi:hypothetical protein